MLVRWMHFVCRIMRVGFGMASDSGTNWSDSVAVGVRITLERQFQGF